MDSFAYPIGAARGMVSPQAMARDNQHPLDPLPTPDQKLCTTIDARMLPTML